MVFVGENTHPFVENQLPRGARTLGELGNASTRNDSIGIGTNTLNSSSALGAIAIGNNVANSSNTGAKSVSIGSAFGSPFDNVTSQNGIGTGSIAIGTSANGDANPSHLGNLSVIIGGGAAYEGCGDGVIAIGQAAGAANAPNDHAICIGTQAGNGSSSAAGANSICIGFTAGESGSGSNSVLIGHAASGTTNNSIVLNATGSTLDSVASGLVIKPIAVQSTSITLENHINLPATATNFTQILVRNPTSGEIRAVDLQTIP
jgi:hypothetical protein